MATIRDTDLLYVQRGETPHNWTGYELKELITGTASDGVLSVGNYLNPPGGTFDGTANLIISVDGTSAATPDKVVVRDSSGNFAGNVITAVSFVGDGQNLTNTGASLSASSGSQRLVMTNLTTGTMTSAATDADLYFTADTNTLHCPNFSGNASSATKLQTARAINGTNFDGTANITTATWGTARSINGVSINGSTNYTLEPYVERDDSSNATRYVTFVDDATAGYKRLNMDSGLTFNPTSNTLSASVFSGSLSGNASSATNAGNADTCDGLHVHGGRNNEKNKIVRTDGSGYIQAGWINTVSGVTNSGIVRVYASQDDYIRYCSPNHLANSMSNVVKTSYNTSLNSDSRNSRGVTRLYRRESNTDYSVQTYWSGTRWILYGYNGDNGHAGCQVAYADSSGYAGSAGSATNAGYANSAGSAPANGGKSSQVTINYNNNSNSTYQMLWGSGNSVYGTSAIYCNPNSNRIYASLFVGGLSGNASSATNAGYANSAGSATNAGYANSAGSASNAGYANSAGSASNAGNANGPNIRYKDIQGGPDNFIYTGWNQTQFNRKSGVGQFQALNIRDVAGSAGGYVMVNSGGVLTNRSSSRLWKKDISEPLSYTLNRRSAEATRALPFIEKFKALNFKTFNYDPYVFENRNAFSLKDCEVTECGLIVEDVELVAPELVFDYNPQDPSLDKDYKTINNWEEVKAERQEQFDNHTYDPSMRGIQEARLFLWTSMIVQSLLKSVDQMHEVLFTEEGEFKLKQRLSFDASAIVNAEDDAAAAAAGVEINGIYHNNGQVRIRLQ